MNNVISKARQVSIVNDSAFNAMVTGFNAKANNVMGAGT
jgi:hypothetical protein